MTRTVLQCSVRLSSLQLQRSSHVSCDLRTRVITSRTSLLFMFWISTDNRWHIVSVCLSSSCPSRGGDRRGGRAVFRADVQRGFPDWPILRRQPACQHHHREGALRGGDASAGFPDQAARGSDTPVSTWTLLCAQSAQFYQLRDQEQRRAHSEELHPGCRGTDVTRTPMSHLQSWKSNWIMCRNVLVRCRSILSLTQNYRDVMKSFKRNCNAVTTLLACLLVKRQTINFLKCRFYFFPSNFSCHVI